MSDEGYCFNCNASIGECRCAHPMPIRPLTAERGDGYPGVERFFSGHEEDSVAFPHLLAALAALDQHLQTLALAIDELVAHHRLRRAEREVEARQLEQELEKVRAYRANQHVFHDDPDRRGG